MQVAAFRGGSTSTVWAPGGRQRERRTEPVGRRPQRRRRWSPLSVAAPSSAVYGARRARRKVEATGVGHGLTIFGHAADHAGLTSAERHWGDPGVLEMAPYCGTLLFTTRARPCGAGAADEHAAATRGGSRLAELRANAQLRVQTLSFVLWWTDVEADGHTHDMHVPLPPLTCGDPGATRTYGHGLGCGRSV